MFKIGCHLSSSKGFEHMAKEILSLGGNTFQFFTRNPRGSKAKEIDLEDVKRFNDIFKNEGLHTLLAHAPYTLNPCSDKPETREFARETMTDDLKRMEYIPHSMYNFHPGSHVGQGVEIGTQYIIELLNEVLTAEQTTTVLLETMAGKGTEIGRNFEELHNILDGVALKQKMGVCLDTCHVFDGGYDIVNDLDSVLEDFDRIIGLDKLKAIHLNDSMNTLGSHKDRHQKIGEGNIGIDAFDRIINHPKLRELPFYLETPNELDGYKKEISMLKERYTP